LFVNDLRYLTADQDTMLKSRLAASFMLGDMTIQRMDNVGIVVDDLGAAVSFFTDTGRL
jgi:hypothetical protein